MIIRQEHTSDYSEVYQLVKEAFATTSYSDGTEPDYLNDLRNKDTFIPELSLVAVKENKIVGQIVLYKMKINCIDRAVEQLVLSPLSVLPSCFNQGIGKSLINEGCNKAKELGYKAVFLCGDYSYYTKIGFVPTYQHGIYHINDSGENVNWCMVRELEPGYLDSIKGTVDIE